MGPSPCSHLLVAVLRYHAVVRYHTAAASRQGLAGRLRGKAQVMQHGYRVAIDTVRDYTMGYPDGG